jgi:hypothetical protein
MGRFAEITPVRDGSKVTATWTALDKYRYLWAYLEVGDYEEWVAVRSEAWEDKTLEWNDVPAGAGTAALVTPRMKGERREWIVLDESPI